MSLNVCSSSFGVLVVPASIGVDIVSNDDIVLAGSTLPSTDRGMVGCSEELHIGRISREVVVSFNLLEDFALSEHFTIPYSTYHDFKTMIFYARGHAQKLSTEHSSSYKIEQAHRATGNASTRQCSVS